MVRELAAEVGVEVPEADARETAEAQRAGRSGTSSWRPTTPPPATGRPGCRARWGESARGYLRGRGVAEEQVAAFRLGVAADGWDDLGQRLGAKGIEEAALHKAGLLVKKDDGRSYDRFRKRLMFPITSLDGQVIGFGGPRAGRGEGRQVPQHARDPALQEEPRAVRHRPRARGDPPDPRGRAGGGVLRRDRAAPGWRQERRGGLRHGAHAGARRAPEAPRLPRGHRPLRRRRGRPGRARQGGGRPLPGRHGRQGGGAAGRAPARSIPTTTPALHGRAGVEALLAAAQPLSEFLMDQAVARTCGARAGPGLAGGQGPGGGRAGPAGEAPARRPGPLGLRGRHRQEARPRRHQAPRGAGRGPAGPPRRPPPDHTDDEAPPDDRRVAVRPRRRPGGQRRAGAAPRGRPSRVRRPRRHARAGPGSAWSCPARPPTPSACWPPSRTWPPWPRRSGSPDLLPAGPLAELARDLIAATPEARPDEAAVLARVAESADEAAVRRIQALCGPGRPEAARAAPQLRRACVRAAIDRMGRRAGRPAAPRWPGRAPRSPQELRGRGPRWPRRAAEIWRRDCGGWTPASGRRIPAPPAAAEAGGQDTKQQHGRPKESNEHGEEAHQQGQAGEEARAPPHDAGPRQGPAVGPPARQGAPGGAPAEGHAPQGGQGRQGPTSRSSRPRPRSRSRRPTPRSPPRAPRPSRRPPRRSSSGPARRGRRARARRRPRSRSSCAAAPRP